MSMDIFCSIQIWIIYTIFAKPKDEEAGPQFASILVSNVTQSELERLLEKLENFFEL